MRFVKKFKKFDKSFILSNTYPSLRLLKFKRPKWLKLQTFLKKRALNFNKEKLFFDYSTKKSLYKSWDKIKMQYKEGLVLKNAILNFFNNAVSVSFFKKAILQKKFSNKTLLNILTLVKPFYRLDILLWKSNIFSSAFQARQYISFGLVYINSKKAKRIETLKKGDVISVNFNKEFQNLQKNIDVTFLYSFLEIDRYNNTIILLKNFKDLDNNDLALLLSDYVIVKKFIDYIKVR